MENFKTDLIDENEMSEEELNDEDLKLILAEPMGEKKIPLFLEFVMTLTKMVVLISTVLVAIVSIISGATWYDILFRVAITLFVLGLFGVLLNYFIGRNFVDAAIVEFKEVETQRALKESEDSESTMDALEA